MINRFDLKFDPYQLGSLDEFLTLYFNSLYTYTNEELNKIVTHLQNKSLNNQTEVSQQNIYLYQQVFRKEIEQNKLQEIHSEKIKNVTVANLWKIFSNHMNKKSINDLVNLRKDSHFDTEVISRLSNNNTLSADEISQMLAYSYLHDPTFKKNICCFRILPFLKETEVQFLYENDPSGQFKHIYDSSPLKIKLDEKYDTVIFCKAPNGFGDVIAGKRLIDHLLQKKPLQKILWYVAYFDQTNQLQLRNHDNVTMILDQNQFMFDCACYAEIYNKQDNPLLQRIDSLFKNSNKVIIYYARWDSQFFNKRSSYNVSRLTEYDLKNEKSDPYMGLGENAKGIFINECDSMTHEQGLQLTLFKKDTYEPVQQELNENKSLNTIINIITENETNNGNFFGYLYPKTSTHDKSPVGYSLELFIMTCIETGIKLQKDSKDLNEINIITPLDQNNPNFQNFQNELQKDFGKDISLVLLDRNGSTTIINNNEHSAIKIRILNPFPLQNDEFLKLMNKCNPFFIGCTGDQSISEVLSHALLPAYQAPSWKVKFQEELCKIMEQSGGNFIKQYVMIYKKMMDSGNELQESIYSNEISDFLIHAMNNKNALNQELKELNHYIHQNKNIYHYIDQKYLSHNELEHFGNFFSPESTISNSVPDKKLQNK